MKHASNDLMAIRELNLSYLQFAQRVLASSREAAVQLGLSTQVADALARLSPAQLAKLASSSQLLCLFRLGPDAMLGAFISRNEEPVRSRVLGDAATETSVL
ncbi:flagellar transcriptional regulator FlhD [Caballeronia sp. LZ016]|nr:flagellar transcriptional regulator FlhD [Caballeronia sp. LZ016]MDR5740168.1 flagellar transcriptional regulator FlhD [Caballeronia sp. LZ016]